MSNKGSSAIFSLTKKIAIIFNLPVVLYMYPVIFSIISCKGSVYFEQNPDLISAPKCDGYAFNEITFYSFKSISPVFSNSDYTVISY